MPPADSLSVSLTFAGIVSTLRTAGCVFAEDEARLLLGEGFDPPELVQRVERRAAGVPLEYVLGWVSFAGLRIAVDPGVFVPRRRTELLVTEAVSLLAAGPQNAVAVDLCCGSGAVGAVLLAAHPGIDLHAADIDPAAVECARRNIEPLGGRLHAGDLFEALPSSLVGCVGVVAVNAPYVPTKAISTMPPEARLHEPRLSLDGGTDGLDVHRRVAASARSWLCPGGHLLIETSEQQAPGTAALVSEAGFSARTVRSEELDATVVVGTAIR